MKENKTNLFSKTLSVLKKCIVIMLCLAIAGCEKSVKEPGIPDVSFTECQQDLSKNNNLLDKVDIEFTDKGVKITYYDFAVTCDFTTVDITYTFANGILDIIQQGSPSDADCICYTDASYMIEGISQDEVQMIFINGLQVYCYNESYPKDIPFTIYSLEGTSCQWKEVDSDDVISILAIINSVEELETYMECIGEHDYPPIDFSKNTLLLAYGLAPSSIVYVGCDALQQISEQHYQMNIDLLTSDLTVLTPWQVPIIIEKLSEGCSVDLIVKERHLGL